MAEGGELAEAASGCRLLSLPWELRGYIYELALFSNEILADPAHSNGTSPHDSAESSAPSYPTLSAVSAMSNLPEDLIIDGFCTCFESRKLRMAQPPLTRTCRTIRAESLPLFYGRTIFILDNIGVENRVVMKHVFYATFDPFSGPVYHDHANGVAEAAAEEVGFWQLAIQGLGYGPKKGPRPLNPDPERMRDWVVKGFEDMPECVQRAITFLLKVTPMVWVARVAFPSAPVSLAWWVIKKSEGTGD